MGFSVRRSFLVLLLLVVLCLLLGGGWSLLNGLDNEQATHEATDKPALAGGESPNGNRNRDAAPPENTPSVPGAPAQPDSRWTLRGRIQWAPDLLIDPRALTAPEDWAVKIRFARRAEDGYDVDDCILSVGPDCRFEEALTPADLPFQPEGAGTPQGIWQVTWQDGDAIGLEDLGNEGVRLDQLTGIVQPSVEGRVIDFKNTLILLTSNAGSDMIMDMCADPDLMPEPEGIAKALRDKRVDEALS